MNILIVEGDIILDEFSNLNRWALRRAANEVKYLFNIYNAEKKELVELFSWCDILAFRTTFLEEYKIMKLAKLLAHIKKPLTIYIESTNVKEHVTKLLDSKTAFELLHHKIYEFDYYDSEHILISLVKKASYYKKKLKLEAEKEVLLQEYKMSRQTAITGRKIRIKKIVAFSESLTKLIEGSIVDEIDNSLVDKIPHRGVWVWGNGEPVKLLKEDNVDEYDIVNSTKETIISDIMKVINVPLKKETEYLIFGVLNDKEKLDKANSICEILKIPKRINRRNIRRLFVNV